MAVVQVLSDKCVWLYSEVLVYLQDMSQQIGLSRVKLNL